MTEMTAAEHLAAAENAEREKAESWERSDTDGFLSQWASGITANQHRIAAQIAENGGMASFAGLFDAQGRRVKARLVEVVNKYRGFGREMKSLWLVLDERDRALHWVNRQYASKGAPSPRSKMGQLGLHEEEEMAPAKAVIKGRGHGLSGTAWASYERTDGGYPPGSVVYGS